MNKSQRIRVDLEETKTRYIKTRLEQDVETLEILSLKIDQKEFYQNFNADYGVLVGRVQANGEVGIPNAKISIFIPIEENDKDRSDIVAAYPYEKPYDKNRDGKRYNLLPRVAQEDPETGAYKPKQPFGSFPTKEEFVSNETWLEVYDKYYKYSTRTNDAGDYMLFGVPVGTQSVHMSVDVTDIGKYSMSPTDMVTQLGYSENLFTDTGDIKPQRDLDDLPHIETQEISVDVVPFWGDSNNFDIGITRQDFRIRAQLVSNFVIFGSYFTMGTYAVNGDPERSDVGSLERAQDDGFYRLTNDDNNNVDFRTNRIGDIDIKLFSYRQDIDMSIVDDDIATSGTTIDPQTDIYRVDSSSYFQYIDDKNGQFILSVPCNRRKIITDEFGNELVVSNDSVNGIFTEFYGMSLVEFEDLDILKTYNKNWAHGGLGSDPYNARVKFKIPQNYYSIRDEENDQTLSRWATNNPWAKTATEQVKESNIWRKNYATFKGGEFYTISQFFSTKFTQTIKETPDRTERAFVNNLKSYTVDSQTGEIYNTIGIFKVSGASEITQAGEIDNVNTIFDVDGIFLYDFPSNAVRNHETATNAYFGGQWMNMSMYFPQIGWAHNHTSSNDRRDQNTADLFWKDYMTGENGERGEWFSVGNSKTQNLIGGEIGAQFMLSAHGFKTDFSLVTKEDAINLNEIDRKGLYQEDQYLNSVTLTGDYKYKTHNIPIDTSDNEPFGYEDYAYDENYIDRDNPYFFKGMYNADCLKLLFEFNYI